MRYLLLGLCLLLSTAVYAQDTDEEGCEPETFDIMAAGTSSAPVDASPGEAVAARTQVELRVEEIISQDGVHVVHFWAPWCSNSRAELRDGWDALVEANDEATFTFVTVWNDGESGREMLREHGIPERVEELTLADHGPSRDRAQRRRSFLGLPLTWVPSTWIYHKNGELAFALNYGEMRMGTIQYLIDAAAGNW